MILEAKIKVADKEPEPEPSKAKLNSKKFPLGLHEKFTDKIKIEEEYANDQIFK